MGSAPHAILGGRYRVIDEISRGGMGVVYRVEHIGTGRLHAAKVLMAHLSTSPSAIERFAREARLPAQIDSEHVVQIIDVAVAPELGNVPFLVMELLDGRDLANLLRERGALTPRETVSIMAQVAEVVSQAHQLGIVHRDLKPANLFLHRRRDGQPMVKVLDFGVASALDGLLGGRAVTATGEALGTPNYMSPEQLRGDRTALGPATDIWALGIVAFELLSGQRYWGHSALHEVVTALLAGEVAAPSELVPGLPADFDAWFAQSCHVDPARRFANVTQQVDALGQALGLQPNTHVELAPTLVITARPPAHRVAVPMSPAPMPTLPMPQTGSPVERTVPAPNRERSGWVMVAVGLSLCAVVIGSVALGMLVQRDESPRQADRRARDKVEEKSSSDGDAPKKASDRASARSQEHVGPGEPTGPSVATVKLSTFDPAEPIRAAVESHFDDLLTCYRQALERQPDMGGRLVLMLSWHPGRTPNSAMCAKRPDLITDKALCGCISTYAEGWKMPDEIDGDRGSVQYMLRLEPEPIR